MPLPRDGQGDIDHDRIAGRHHGHHADAVTVRDLLARAVQSGDALGLAWKPADLDGELALVRPYVQPQFPTAIMPAIGWPDEWDAGHAL